MGVRGVSYNIRLLVKAKGLKVLKRKLGEKKRLYEERKRG